MTPVDESGILPACLLTFYCPLTPEVGPEAEQLKTNTLVDPGTGARPYATTAWWWHRFTP